MNMAETARKVGTYQLGPRSVAVFVDVSSGDGYFSSLESKIVVGLRQDLWSSVVAVLIHEGLEFAAMDMGTRFEPAPNYGNSSDSYFFAATHPQFTEACGRVAMLVAGVLPELATCYKKAQARR